MNVGPGHFAVLSAIVFALGLYGVLSRRNPLGLVMSMWVLFSAPVIALVGFTHTGRGADQPPMGDALAFFAIVAVAAEGVLGVALALLLWRRGHEADGDELAEADV
jgi:NADH:ubiquinone oxidoreductase subunit K